jgi:NAD-dependent SIR2 family protein deacetylase
LGNKSNVVVYSGRGISSRSGADKYGSNSVDEKRFHLKPTLAHHILAYLCEKKGYIDHWVQPNHDRLAQKAGFSQGNITEYFGAWSDSRNPVVKDKDFGSPKAEAHISFEEQVENVKVCLCIGNSLSGIQSDMIAQNASDVSNGLVIINPKSTPKDHLAAVRIWGAADDVLRMLAEKLHQRELDEMLLDMKNSDMKQKEDLDLDYIEKFEKKHPLILPDPELEQKGEEWMEKYPTNNFHNYDYAMTLCGSPRRNTSKLC